MPTGLEKVKALVDNTGLAHIFISSKQINEVHHVVLGPDGVIERELIKSAVDTPRNLDAAFDRSGRLHVLIGNEHMIKQEGSWVAVERTTLERGRPYDPDGGLASLPGARDLTWAFLIGGGGGRHTRTMGLVCSCWRVSPAWTHLALAHASGQAHDRARNGADLSTHGCVLEPESSLDTDFWAFGCRWPRGHSRCVRAVAIYGFYGSWRNKPREVCHMNRIARLLRRASSEVTSPLRDRRQLLAIPPGQALSYTAGPIGCFRLSVSRVDSGSGAALRR